VGACYECAVDFSASLSSSLSGHRRAVREYRERRRKLRSDSGRRNTQLRPVELPPWLAASTRAPSERITAAPSVQRHVRQLHRHGVDHTGTFSASPGCASGALPSRHWADRPRTFADQRQRRALHDQRASRCAAGGKNTSPVALRYSWTIARSSDELFFKRACPRVPSSKAMRAAADAAHGDLRDLGSGFR